MRNILITASIFTLAAGMTACGGAPDENPPTPSTPEKVAMGAEAQTPEKAEAPAEETRELGSTGTYKIDPGHTSVIWKVRHLGLSDYTARFTDVDATLEFNPQDASATSLTVSIDPKSVATNYVGDYKGTHPDSGFETWDEDITMSENWFNAGTHDSITFTATEITKTGPNTGKVTGDLNFMGVTKPLTLDVTYNGTIDMRGTEKIGFSATGSLDRTEFGMDTYAPNISADVDLIIETEFAKVDEQE